MFRILYIINMFKPKELLFFNKEGNPVNTKYNEQLDIVYSNFYFDKNSTDTFKSQGLYVFEKIEGTSNNFNLECNSFYIKNTGGITINTKNNTQPQTIQNILLTNYSSNYYTKWIYVDNANTYFYEGQWVYFTNLDGFHNTDFDTVITYKQLHQIIKVEKNRLLIQTQTANDIPIINILPVNATIHAVNNINVLNNPTNIQSEIYNNRKISLITDSENSAIYTIESNTEIIQRKNYIIDFDIDDLSAPITYQNGDTLEIKVLYKTSNDLIFNGDIVFNDTINRIDIDYIPYYLNIGDKIYVTEKTSPVNIFNKVELTITDIDKINNYIYVLEPLVSETVDCELYFLENKMLITQDVLLDINNNPDINKTLYKIVEDNSANLFNRDVPLIFNVLNNTLEISSLYVGDIYNISCRIINNNTNINIVSFNNNTYNIPTIEEFNIIEYIESDYTEYNKTIAFYNIDNLGLTLKINGVNYKTNFDTDVITTLTDFITAHATTLLNLGIIITQTLNTLQISTNYNDIPITVDVIVGDNTDYEIYYSSIQINNITTQLLININGVEYLEYFDTDINTTINNWVNKYKFQLKQLGIIVNNTLNDTLIISTLQPSTILNINVNFGYNTTGITDVIINKLSYNNHGTIICSHEIVDNLNTYNFFDYYSLGQKITLSNLPFSIMNKSYNIIGLTDNTISLSYQGNFQSQSLIDVGITSDFFIRFPKYGFSSINNPAKILWTWKNTQTDDIFLYDFTGNQLTPYIDTFPQYNGILPLCGINGDIALKLNKEPNTDINEISNPLKQQTVFDTLHYTLPFNDDISNNNIEPNPMQIFIGYNSQYEKESMARLYMELHEDISFNLTPTSISDDIIIFKDNYLELSNTTNIYDFIQLGFYAGQVIEITSTDINGDNLQLAKLENNGLRYRIKEVYSNKIIFDKNVINETSVKIVNKPNAPFYDIAGNLLTVNRFLNVKLTVVPRVIAYFDFNGESEHEDERHKINLNNKNLNILKLQDFYIFKEVDINENGIDWVFMNRKRKELIEIYGDIFNNISSYKAIIHAINFFGYNDLTFTEYFQNINPESSKFGELLNMELLNIFDKTIKGWEYSNVSYKKLRNDGYRKTNLFSLNYKITDINGNFIDGYSSEEVKIKLLGLKKWLTENSIIPLGSKIIDINGKYIMPNNYNIKHDTYMTTQIRIEEYSNPIEFKVDIYPQIYGNNLDVRVDFFSKGDIEWYDYSIKTLKLDLWKSTNTYVIGECVYHNNILWKCINNTITNDEPGITNSWEETTLAYIPVVQQFSDSKSTEEQVSFTINSNLDPHFIIEVNWDSGYGNTYKNTKTYTLIPDIFNNINNNINMFDVLLQPIQI